MQIWLEIEPGAISLASLRKACGSVYSREGRARWCSNLSFRLQLHQPSEPAIRLLDKFLVTSKSSFVINQVELALDLITTDIDHRRELNDFIERHSVKRWHGRQRVVYCEDTRYSGRKRWGSQQLVQYATRPSKSSGQPCVHLEWRVGGKPQVEALGVYDLMQLATLDHRRFWMEHLCLEEVNYTMLGKQILRQGRAKKPLQSGPYQDWYPCLGARIGRAAATRSNGPTAQDIRDWCREEDWFHPETCMMKIDVEPYLPRSGVR